MDALAAILLFFPGGKIDFWDTGATFVFNGTSCVLVNDIASIAAAYAANNFAALALAKDYDAGPDGTYHTSAVPTPMDGMFEGLGHTISNFSASERIAKSAFSPVPEPCPTPASYATLL